MQSTSAEHHRNPVCALPAIRGWFPFTIIRVLVIHPRTKTADLSHGDPVSLHVDVCKRPPTAPLEASSHIYIYCPRFIQK